MGHHGKGVKNDTTREFFDLRATFHQKLSISLSANVLPIAKVMNDLIAG